MMRHQALSVIIAVVAAYSLSAPGISQAAYPACQNGEVNLGATAMSPGVGHRGVAVVEGVAVDDNGNQCPSYANLRVTPPNTTETISVAVVAYIDACALQVHPVT
jgi:hypothetical protein